MVRTLALSGYGTCYWSLQVLVTRRCQGSIWPDLKKDCGIKNKSRPIDNWMWWTLVIGLDSEESTLGWARHGPKDESNCWCCHRWSFLSNRSVIMEFSLGCLSSRCGELDGFLVGLFIHFANVPSSRSGKGIWTDRLTRLNDSIVPSDNAFLVRRTANKSDYSYPETWPVFKTGQAWNKQIYFRSVMLN